MAADSLHTALLDICDELLLHIFAYLEIPELLACSRTCHRLRPLTADPILHAHRLRAASHTLSHHLAHRPPLASLRPPLSAIYLTPTHVAARKVRWSMLRIGLSRRLARRPSAAALVRSNVLPGECCGWDPGKGEVVWGRGVAWGIVGVRRRVLWERGRDLLRGWVGGLVRGRVEREVVGAGEGEGGRVGVRGLVVGFAGRGREGEKREGENGRGEVARLHVWRLRRFWEGVGGQGPAVSLGGC